MSLKGAHHVEYNKEFMEFLNDCAEDPLFLDLCHISEITKERHENLDLVIRFFALLNQLPKSSDNMKSFFENYIEEEQKSFDSNKMKNDFHSMLHFVYRHFPLGFAKSRRDRFTSRVRFEAISVGVALALRENPNLQPKSVKWLDSKEFLLHTTNYAINSSARVIRRILYVKHQLLGDER